MHRYSKVPFSNAFDMIKYLNERMKQKRLTIITQWFDPEPTSKGLHFAHELMKQGFAVDVITGYPNYPGGIVYSGYNIKIFQRELIDNVVVTRIPLYPSHGKSILGRVLNYASFSISVLFYGIFIARNSDILYVYHPPLTVGFAACFIKKIWKIPIVYDIQDIWPDSLQATGFIRNRVILHLISFACNFVYKQVNHIIVLSPGFKNLLLQRGVPETKISIVYNWANENASNSSNISNPVYIPNKYTHKIMFAGNIGRAQGLDTIIDAAELLKSKLPNVCFIILGSGVELKNLQNYALFKKTDNVIFLPPVSMYDVNNYLQSADVLLVHLKADPLFKITIPSKTQAYMAAGKPILMAVEGEAKNLIQAANCGLTARSEDPEDIANVVEKFVALDQDQLKQLGLNGMNYYHSNLSMKVGVRYFSKIFHEVAK